MVVLAFVCLGFLIGNLVGLSAESALAVIVPLLFAFGGGSAVAFLHKLGPAERTRSAGAVVALSIGCLIGVYVGIVVSERQALSPSKRRLAREATTADLKYLRSADIEKVNEIDQRYKGGALSAAEAYERLYSLVSP
jgi:hypothetical protein